jgi:hypothetical protein
LEDLSASAIAEGAGVAASGAGGGGARGETEEGEGCEPQEGVKRSPCHGDRATRNKMLKLHEHYPK